MTSPSKVILLVEDEAIIAAAGKMSLQRYGYSVVVANSGEAALSVVETNPAIDLILMDIDLGSGWDGTETAERILAVHDLPVVFLSSHAEPEIVAKTERITSYGYVVKNSNIAVLDASIKMAFKLFDAKTALQEIEARQQILLENIPEVITVLDPEGRVQYTSPNIVKWFGWSPHDDRDRSRWDRVHPDDLAESQRIFRSVLAGAQAGPARFRYLCKDGSYKTVELRVTNRMTDPLIRGVLITYHDITAAKAVEDELIREKGLLRSLIESSPDPIFAKDEEGRYFVMNDAGAKENRLEAADMIGRTDDQLFDPELARFYRDADDRVRTTGEMLVQEFVNPYDGREHHIRTHKAPWRDASGRIIGLIGLSREVTETKNAEKELVRQRNLLQTIIDSVSGNIFAKDLEGRYWTINAAGAQKYGYSAAQMVGKTNFELLDHSTAEAYRRTDEEVLSTGQSVEAEEMFEVDGVQRYFLIRKSLWRDEAGQVLGVIGVSNDITSAKLAQKRIESFLAEKELLLREVHHRIKNNMATVAGLLALQASESADLTVSRALEDARNRVNSMMVLYDKLYRTDDFQSVPSEDYLGALIQEIAGSFPNGNKVQFETQIGDFPLDLRKIQFLGIILNELLTNAMKYAFSRNLEGRILVKATADAQRVTLVVSDNGPGIPEAESGAGFGLRLVEMLTENLEGTIRFENENGTRVVLEFPV